MNDNAATIQIPGFRIVRELGRGGMASVYLAVQESLDREVALKIMSPALLAADAEFSERFVREGRTIAKLNHPNVVTVHDIGVADGHHYIAMEYIDGEDIKDLMQQGLEPQDSIEIIKQTAAALGYAHEKHFVHRDIKPDNILLRVNRSVVLSDFGIAKTLDSATRMTATGISIGTPHYMSPEQARGNEVDARSDLYSLGVVFYEMLVSKPPFDAKDSFAIGLMHISEPVPSLPVHLARYQPILNRLLAKDPNDRYPDANALIEALDSIHDSPAQPSAEDPPETVLMTQVATGAGESVSSRDSDSRAPWKWGVAAAVVAAVGVAAYLYLAPGPPPPLAGDQTPQAPVRQIEEKPDTPQPEQLATASQVNEIQKSAGQGGEADTRPADTPPPEEPAADAQDATEATAAATSNDAGAPTPDPTETKESEPAAASPSQIAERTADAAESETAETSPSIETETKTETESETETASPPETVAVSEAPDGSRTADAGDPTSNPQEPDGADATESEPRVESTESVETTPVVQGAAESAAETEVSAPADDTPGVDDGAESSLVASADQDPPATEPAGSGDAGDPQQTRQTPQKPDSQSAEVVQEPAADSAPAIAGSSDAGSSDAETSDAGTSDAGSSDAGTSDAGSSDAGTSDAASSDAGSSDAGSSDAGSSDAGSSDAGRTQEPEQVAKASTTQESAVVEEDPEPSRAARARQALDSVRELLDNGKLAAAKEALERARDLGAPDEEIDPLEKRLQTLGRRRTAVAHLVKARAAFDANQLNQANKHCDAAERFNFESLPGDEVCAELEAEVKNQWQQKNTGIKANTGVETSSGTTTRSSTTSSEAETDKVVR